MMGRSSMGSQLYGDRVKKMAKGSKLKMVKGPSGKMVPDYAADGVGKMSYGGKMNKMAAGGKMSRGDGCCMKGKTKGRKV
tara:strand:+ start:710 stop:949 length:240 start_codon:yes stop_codon:yes gene_type:complete